MLVFSQVNVFLSEDTSLGVGTVPFVDGMTVLVELLPPWIMIFSFSNSVGGSLDPSKEGMLKNFVSLNARRLSIACTGGYTTIPVTFRKASSMPYCKFTLRLFMSMLVWLSEINRVGKDSFMRL